MLGDGGRNRAGAEVKMNRQSPRAKESDIWTFGNKMVVKKGEVKKTQNSVLHSGTDSEDGRSISPIRAVLRDPVYKPLAGSMAGSP